MHSHNFDNNYLLLDLAISIYIFHDKDKFINFKRVIKDQRLLYDTKIIIVKSWGEILLPLRIGNQISILILKEIAYVLDFLLKFVSLDWLEN